MSFQQRLSDITDAASDSGVAAIFDFDGTIIAGYSATVFLRDQLKRGDLSRAELMQITQAVTSWGLGNTSFSALMAVHAQYLAGTSEAEYIAHSERLFKTGIARLIYPEIRQLIAAHRAAGHRIAIISSATPYQVLPCAQDLGIDDVYCTELEVKHGKFTGRVVSPTCFGEGKVTAAKHLARRRKIKLANSFFYSDSADDIELLEAVGRPVVLNPRGKLSGIARRTGWPSAKFDSRGKTSVSQVVRSMAATTNLVSSFVMGLPIYALTKSPKEAVNFSISLFADTTSAIIGLDLDIKGEKNLWRQRPAVFMFNHQSKVDVAIMAKLVRRDIVGVGKKEIRDIPIIGKVMEMAGTVFIDRSDRAAAIETLRPLLSAIQNEGKSLVIAPEGTRTPTPKLAPFKKGGFHLAMQAGVPIVPVVIHNAGDIAPKGDFLFRKGQVRIEVLPPISTDGWSSDTLNEHIATVRQQFLNTLGQSDDTGSSPVSRPPKGRVKRRVSSGQATAKTADKARAEPQSVSGSPSKTRAKSRPSKTAKSTTGGKKRATTQSKTPTR